MAKTLIYADGSPTSVKIGDTNTTLSLKLKFDSGTVDLQNAKSITVKVGNNQGFIKDIDLVLNNQSDLANGVINISSTDLLDQLVAGTYYIEAWVANSDETTDIYPSTNYPQTLAFTISKNVESATTTVITTVTLETLRTEWSSNYDKLKAAIIALGGTVD